MREGDANSAYFHSNINFRRRRNSILALRVGSVSEVRAEIVDYFRNHFSEALMDRPTLDGVAFASISEDDGVVWLSLFVRRRLGGLS